MTQRRFSRTGGADDRHGAAGFGHQRQVLDHRGAREVTEIHPVEFDAAGNGSGVRVAGSRLCSSASSRSKTRSALAIPDCSVLYIPATLAQRLVELPHVLDERLDTAKGDLPSGHLQAAHNRDLPHS